jgi:hypothetical protein
MEKDDSAIASFLTDNGSLPVIDELVNEGIPISCYLLTTNSSGIYVSSQQLYAANVGSDPFGNYSIQYNPTSPVFVDPTGNLNGGATGLTNLTIPYLSFSNGISGAFYVQFQSTNTSTITTNVSLAGAIVVTNTTDASAKGVYTNNYYNLFDLRNGYGPNFAYGVWINTNGSGYKIVFNDPAQRQVNVGDNIYIIENSSGVDQYDNYACSDNAPINTCWQAVAGGGTVPTVYFQTQATTTNIINRIYPVLTQDAGTGFSVTATNRLNFTTVSSLTNTLGREATAIVSAGTSVALQDTNGVTIATIGTVATLDVLIPMHVNMRLAGTGVSAILY